jgi:hypothetical protein
MSQQITTAMVDMFSSNVMHLAQQKGSRLREYCRMESQSAESAFYDRIGSKSAKRKEGRHSDVVYQDTPHSRRMVTMEDYYDSDLVDKEDKLRTIMDPENEYAKAIGMALGRKIDEIIIDAALGNAYGGKKGTEVVALPNSQKLIAHDGASTGGNGLNVRTLRAARKKFKQNEAIDQGEKLILAHAAQQADDLLAETEFTSSDFNAVKTLVNGETDTFMGFKFVQLELLPFTDADITYNINTGAIDGAGTGTVTAGEGRRCFAFTASRGILCALGLEVNGRIDELPQKHFSHQVYGSLTMGSTRMEEVQVLEIVCLEV